MRRFAAVAASSGAVITTLALATPADAAAQHSFHSPAITNVTSSGFWAHSGSRVVFSGRVTDRKYDGYTACVGFKWVTSTKIYTGTYWIVNSKGGRADGTGIYANLGNHTTVTGVQHFYVKGCRIVKKTGKTYSTAWKQLF